MKKAAVISILLSCIVAIFAVGMVLKRAHAQYQSSTAQYGPVVQPQSYVSVVQIADNKVGFYDYRDGKLYVYDVNTKACEKILKVQQLGLPLLEISKN